MSISVAIAAHPSRADMVQQLQNKLQCPPGHLSIVWDEKDNIWDTHRRAWGQANINIAQDADITHHLVLQDDAVPCLNLLPALENALEYVSDKPVSLYFGNATSHPKIVRTVATAQREGATWIKTSGTWWGVGIMLPVNMISDMLLFCENRRETYDRRLAIWCEHNGHEVYHPWPSLVDHADTSSLLYPGRRPGRKAYQFVGEDFDAMTWEPYKGVVQCGKIAGRLIRLGSQKGG